MKLLLFLVLITTSQLKAQNLIIAHFDPFDGAKVNNSETVAQMVYKELKSMGINASLCPLQTSFEKAYPQLKNCLQNIEADLVIGLGETGCKLKAEFVGRNLDKTYGPDNLGVERNNTPIIATGAPYLSLRYPLPQMYCGLSTEERKRLNLSNNAGSFVCNNVAYQMRYFHPEKMVGFIHVPSHFCKNLKQTNKENSQIITKMITVALSTEDNGPYLPHESNSEEIPITKDQLRKASRSVDNKCYQDFYSRLRRVDSRGFWPF
ncbi:MAG TPA: hypothetical protein VKY27_08815 [Bacteriovoracaceae bacterium]|nr:hypothetical protein [Bacteriovoracaceae bacterium]